MPLAAQKPHSCTERHLNGQTLNRLSEEKDLIIVDGVSKYSPQDTSLDQPSPYGENSFFKDSLRRLVEKDFVSIGSPVEYVRFFVRKDRLKYEENLEMSSKFVE